jgi:hypothetical protein
MTPKTLEEWTLAANSVTPLRDILIDGEWTESQSGAPHDQFLEARPCGSGAQKRQILRNWKQDS